MLMSLRSVQGSCAQSYVPVTSGQAGSGGEVGLRSAHETSRGTGREFVLSSHPCSYWQGLCLCW